MNTALAFGRTGLDRCATDAAAAVASAVAVPVTEPKTAFLALLARSTIARFADVERALTEKRSIVWLSAMHATECLVARDLAPAMLGAFRQVALEETRKSLADAGMNLRAVDAAELRVLDVLRSSEGPLTMSAITVRSELDSRTADGAIWLLSAGGILVRAGRLGGLRSVLRQVDLVERWLKGLVVPDAASSRAAVARAYLASYGPATVEDLIWWSGFTRAEARAALDAFGAVESRGRFDTPEAPKDRAWPARDVRLLPACDPVSLAWKNPDRFVPRARIPAVYSEKRRPEPLVIASGRAIGTWTFREGPRLWAEKRLANAASREWERIRQVVRAEDRAAR